MNTNLKIDLKDITFCIPVRIESSHRMRNLKTLLKYLDKFFNTNYIVLEADNTPLFDNDSNIKNLNYIFRKDENIIFHRTKYINEMLYQVETTYAAIWDTDAIAPIEQIQEAYEILQKSNNTMVYPFSGIFVSLNELTSMFFSQHLNIDSLKARCHSTFYPYGFYSVGGAYMVNTLKYLKAGGENENFYGWGAEDAERNVRIQILELGVEKVEGSLFHLYHTRGINSSDSNEKNGLMNQKEFCKICAMSTSELNDYVKTWSWQKTIE